MIEHEKNLKTLKNKLKVESASIDPKQISRLTEKASQLQIMKRIVPKATNIAMLKPENLAALKQMIPSLS